MPEGAGTVLSGSLLDRPETEGPGWAAQLVRVLSWCARVVGLIPSQGAQESTNEYTK